VSFGEEVNDWELEADAVEIRMRAPCRADELRQVQDETVGLNGGGRPGKTGVKHTPVSKPTLAFQGIDKNLAKEMRALDALSNERFETAVAGARDAVSRAVLAAWRRFRPSKHRAKASADARSDGSSGVSLSASGMRTG
jgi:hypothetical protein